MKNIAYIIIGGNIGNVKNNFLQAFQQIEKTIGPIFVCSPIYKTQAWGNTQQPDFLNQVFGVYTNLNCFELLHYLLNIEQNLGRVREKKYDPRTIDLDILFFNEEIINTENLIVPHPKIPERNFVLQPLCAIIPDYIHPFFNISIQSLAQRTQDNLHVKVDNL